MLTLGIDPSSACVGLSLIDGPDLLWTRHWKPRSLVGGPRLLSYEEWLEVQLISMDRLPDLAVVEFCSNVAWASLHAIRVLAHFESASYRPLTRAGVRIRYDLTATTARSLMGLPKDKEAAGARVRAMFPLHDFANLDETDATILAMTNIKGDGANFEAPAPPPKSKKGGAKKRRAPRKT